MTGPPPRLATLDVTGTSREAGRALGRFGAAAVHGHLIHTEAWASVQAWRDTTAARAMAALTRERFPRIAQELEGLAEGLGLPFDEVMLWNCRGDLWALGAEGWPALPTPDGCTTVQLPAVPGRALRRIVHNEDGDPGFAGRCALAACRIEGTPPFVAFVYPGSLAGHTFAVTDAGLALTVNNLRCVGVAAGVPRMVLTRALLDARTLDEATAVLGAYPRAGGFHLTLAHRDDPRLVSVEFRSQACSIVDVERPSLHANHAIHPALRALPQHVTGSSASRQRRGAALVAEAGADPLAILADAAEAALPILRRDPQDPDGENTLATADIRLHASHIDWQVHEDPRAAARLQGRDGKIRPDPQSAEGR